MKKACRWIGFLTLLAVLVFVGTVFSDRQVLRQELVRLHVVAASDAQEDQAIKLRVKDEVSAYLLQALAGCGNAEEAKSCLQADLEQIRQVANRVLEKLGKNQTVVVSYLQEEFPTRFYETFRLPAGVYDSLKITIGAGEGQNWWCVVFPSLCSQSTAVQVKDAAVGAGFSYPLTDALIHQDGVQLRFYCLELLGKIENFFHRG